MDDIEVKKRVQILRIAEAILVEDGNSKFTKQYDEWTKAAASHLESQEPTPPAPTPPPSPTQAQIVAKALEFFYACEELATIPISTPPQVAESIQREVSQPAPASVSTYDAVLDPVRKIFGPTSGSVLPSVDVATAWAAKDMRSIPVGASYG